MPYNGNGKFTRLYNWTQDAANGINISSSRFDTNDNDFATAFSNAVTRDGQGQMAANFVPSAASEYTVGSANYPWVGGYFSGVLSNVTAGNVNDAYSNGWFQRVAGYTGGTAGHVATCLTVQTEVSSASATNYEWAFLSVLNNYATAGENVAGYFQATKNGNIGPTWGAVIEVIEATPINNPTNGTVALEIDLNCNGTDNAGAGSRVGVDLAIRQNQANLPSSTYAQANWGFRIQNSGVVGNNVGFGFALDTGMIANVCFDSSHGTVLSAALQLATGQSIVFDGPTNQNTAFYFDGTNLRYDYGAPGGRSNMFLCDNTGNFTVTRNLNVLRTLYASNGVSATAPVGGQALTAIGAVGYPAVIIDGSTTTGQSKGLQIFAGTNTSDYPLQLINATNTANLFAVDGQGNATVFAGLKTVGSFSCFNQTSLPSQPTGYGTPTGGLRQGSFAASTITLQNLAAAVAQMIVDLKTYGLFGA